MDGTFVASEQTRPPGDELARNREGATIDYAGSLEGLVMSLTLLDARRIADDVLSKEHPRLELVGVTPSEGGSRYTEVIVRIRGCHAEPCHVIIGVDRDASEAAFRQELDRRVRQHVNEERQ